MKRLTRKFSILAISIASLIPSTVSADALSLTEKGDSAYEADNYVQAEQYYLKAVQQEGASSSLYYNIGNAYYRQGNLGKAVVNYERALRLDPTDSDARANLEFVQGKLADKQLDDGSIMTRISDSTINAFKADTWAVIAVGLFAVFIACMAVYLFASAVALRKISFFGGIVVFIVTFITVVISFAAANRKVSSDYGVILPPAAQLATTPREARSQAEQAFLLHEGTKVLIVDSISTAAEGKWYEVRVGARDRAWIKADDIEKI